jgi:hypothetical protein
MGLFANATHNLMGRGNIFPFRDGNLTAKVPDVTKKNLDSKVDWRVKPALG